MPVRQRRSKRAGSTQALSDPRSSTTNFMDVILVLFVAMLMLAVQQGNISLEYTDSDIGEIEKLDAELTAAVEGDAVSSSTFDEVGTVYVDQETGELYLVASEDEME